MCLVTSRWIMRNIPHEPPEMQLESFVVLIRNVKANMVL